MPSVPPLPPLVDREQELRELRALMERGEPALALLYGRRRVGKTFLLDHAFDGGRSFYFLAGDTTPELNRRELLREIAPLLADPDDADPSHFPSWRNVFRLFADLAADGPFTVVLDEFQYLLGGEEDVASHLMAVWDRELRGRPLVLVACGSHVGTMERLEHGAGPLYGRWSWAARLRPFDYFDSGRMLGERPVREKALAYGVLGGTPRFLATLRAGEPLARRLTEAVLSPRGEVHIQLDRVVEQEKGIRDPADYRAVLAAIAAGKTQIDEIADATGLRDRAHVVRRALRVLEELELVWRERNFDAPPKAAYQHRIADNAVRFWYRFVHPNRSRLETGTPADVWNAGVEPHLNAYMGKVFERVVREAFERCHRAWGLPPARDWSRWEGRDRNRRSIEVDLVARLEDGRILTGEIKWSSRPVESEVLTGLLRNLDDLGRSGQGWAKDALSDSRSAGFLFVSASGFTAEFKARAKKDPRILLRTLDDLYSDARLSRSTPEALQS